MIISQQILFFLTGSTKDKDSNTPDRKSSDILTNPEKAQSNDVLSKNNKHLTEVIKKTVESTNITDGVADPDFNDLPQDITSTLVRLAELINKMKSDKNVSNDMDDQLLSDAGNTIESNTILIDELEYKNAQLVKSLQECNEYINMISKDQESLLTEINKMADKNKEHISINDELSLKINELEEKYRNSNSEISQELFAKTDNLISKNNEKDTEINDLKNQILTLKNKISQSDFTISNLESTFTTYQEQYSKSLEEKNDDIASINHLNIELNRISELYHKRTAELESYLSSTSQCANMVATMEATLDNLKLREQSLKSEMNDYKQSMQQKYDNMSRTLESIEKERNDLLNERENNYHQIQSLKDKCANMNTSASSVDSDVYKSLEEKYHAANLKVEQYTKMYNDSEIMIANMKNDHIEYETSINNYRQNNIMLNDRVVQYEAIVNNLKIQLSEYDEMKNQNSILQDQIHNLTLQIQSYYSMPKENIQTVSDRDDEFYNDILAKLIDIKTLVKDNGNSIEEYNTNTSDSDKVESLIKTISDRDDEFYNDILAKLIDIKTLVKDNGNSIEEYNTNTSDSDKVESLVNMIRSEHDITNQLIKDIQLNNSVQDSISQDYQQLNTIYEKACIENKQASIEIKTLQSTLEETQDQLSNLSEKYQLTITNINNDNHESMLTMQKQINEYQASIDDLSKQLDASAKVIKDHKNKLVRERRKNMKLLSLKNRSYGISIFGAFLRLLMWTLIFSIIFAIIVVYVPAWIIQVQALLIQACKFLSIPDSIIGSRLTTTATG